jgi:RNA polymerase sigma factor (TIGR02999 family)
MAAADSGQVSALLAAWGAGDKAALDELIPIVHAQLRRLAHHYMMGERAGRILQTSALVNEVYVRLVDCNRMQWQDRAHFFAVAAQAMRRILVDYARARQAAKRGGEVVRIDVGNAAIKPRPVDLIALDRALDELAASDERGSRIVELRYFGGLSIEETAEALGVSTATVEREWRTARARLYRALQGGALL